MAANQWLGRKSDFAWLNTCRDWPIKSADMQMSARPSGTGGGEVERRREGLVLIIRERNSFHSQSLGAMSTARESAQRYLPPYQDLNYSGSTYSGYDPPADRTCEEHQFLGENGGLNSENFLSFPVFQDFIASQKYARLSDANSVGAVFAQANHSDVGLTQEQISVTSSVPNDVLVSRGQPRSSAEVSRGQKKPEIIVYPWMQKVQNASHGRCIASLKRPKTSQRWWRRWWCVLLLFISVLVVLVLPSITEITNAIIHATCCNWNMVLVYPSNRSFIRHSCLFECLIIYLWLIHSLCSVLIHRPLYAFIHSFISKCMHSSNSLFTSSCIHSFVYPLHTLHWSMEIRSKGTVQPAVCVCVGWVYNCMFVCLCVHDIRRI